MAIRAHTSVFIPPLSASTIYIKIANDIGLSTSRENETAGRALAKRVARFVTCAVFIPFFTPLTIFFNTLCFTFKGGCALFTHLSGSNLLNHRTIEYSNDMNLHIAYVVKELANNFFIGIIAVIYTFDPRLVEIGDNFFINSIKSLCVFEENPPPVDRDSHPPSE